MMKMKFLLSAALLVFSFSLWCVPAKIQYTPEDFRRITASAAGIIDQNHYAGMKMSADFSARIFDELFKEIDPARIFFTQEDVQSFAASRETLGFQLQNGEYELVFKVYGLFRQRFAEYRKFTAESLKKGIDFNVEETYRIDRDKQPRPADRTEQRELWRKKLKNDLLIFKMMEMAEKEEETKNEKKAKSKDAKDTKDAKEKKTSFKRTKLSPEKRILQRQRDFGNEIDQRDKIDILGILLNAMAQSYGAHSNYSAPRLSEDFEIGMSLSLFGIGATLTSDNGYIKIVELVTDGPADKSGKLHVNDRIVSVTQENGECTDLIDMPVSKAVQFIRGPKGSKLTLDILTENGSSTRVSLIRDKIKLEDSAAKGEVREITLNGKKSKIGIINLPSFYMDFEAVMRGEPDARRASEDVRKILLGFQKQKVEAIVVDLRRNGGGSLPDVIVLTGLFMKDGPVVQVRSKEQIAVECDEDPACYFDGPVVVLTSKLTASAAEIFSAALRDNGRAIVVGDSRTFGKGTVLDPKKLDVYSTLFGEEKPQGTLTYESMMFFRVPGGSVQQLGIAADIVLPSLTEEMKIGEMFMENHLPWDSIAPVSGVRSPELSGTMLEKLRAHSKVRIAKDAAYQRLLKQIELYKKFKDRKEVTLNAKRRWEEYCKEKQVTEAAEDMLDESLVSEKQKEKKKKNAADPILAEAAQIAAEMAQEKK